MGEEETVKEFLERGGSFVERGENRDREMVAIEFKNRYREIQAHEMDIKYDRDTYYVDIARMSRNFDVQVLAEMLSISPQTVYQWMKRGRVVARERETARQT